MKSIEISVPRNLIRKFYPHPESHRDGDHVADLINGMYTDVFYREEGDFITITNDIELITFLKKNQMVPRDYFFRNGVYSLRQVADCDNYLIDDWKNTSPIIFKLDLPKKHNLPSEFMFCFYWIEVGKAVIIENEMALKVYEKDLIHMIDIGVVVDMIMGDINKLDSR